MTKRKITLLAAIVVLASIFIWQTIAAKKNTVSDLNLKEQADTIMVAPHNGAEYKLSRQNDTNPWLLNTTIPADSDLSAEIAESIQKIRVLNRIAPALGTGGDLERFGLAEGTCTTVEALKGGKTLRKMRIGKSSATGTQTYIQLDNSNEVLLVSGSLGSIFNKTVEQLTAKEQAGN